MHWSDAGVETEIRRPAEGLEVIKPFAQNRQASTDGRDSGQPGRLTVVTVQVADRNMVALPSERN